MGISSRPRRCISQRTARQESVHLSDHTTSQSIVPMSLSIFNTTRLEGKTAVITGASGGIGASTALLFAKANVNLVLLARRKAALDEVAERCRAAAQKDIKVVTLELDVTDREKVGRLVDDLRALGVGSFDVLVNNAGGAIGKEPVGDISLGDVDTMFQTNLLSLIQITQLFVNEFKKQDSGHVINIGSVAGREPYVGGSIYCAVKHAVRAFGTSLMKEVVGTGIRVTEVAPGFVETNFSVTRFRGDEEAAKAVYKGMTPLTPEDIAEEVVWCALRPPHVQIAEVYVLPTCQAAATIISRKE